MTPDQLEREIAEKACKIVTDNRLKACQGDEEAVATIFPLKPSPKDFIGTPTMEAALKVFQEKMREVAEKAFDDSRIEASHLSTAYKYPTFQEWLKENNLLNDNDQG